MLRSRLRDASRIGHHIHTRTRATATASTRSERGSASHVSSTVCYVPERLRTKNLLRALADILPRILEPSLLERECWSERISNAVEKLDTEPCQPSIAFWSPAPSSSTDLITALLEDPLSSDDARRRFLARRWDDHDGPVLRISYDSTTVRSEDSQANLTVASSWLHNAEATIFEVRGNDPQRVITHLLKADIVVLVFDSPADMVSQKEVLQQIFESSSQTCGDLHFVTNNSVCGTIRGEQASQASFANSLSALIPKASHHNTIVPRVHLHAASSEAAIDAQAAFRKDQLQEALGTSPSSTYAASVGRFQTSLGLSGLPRLSWSLLESLAVFRNNRAPSAAVRSSINTVSAAIYRARRSVSGAVEEVKDAQRRIKQLSAESRSQIREFKNDIFRDGDLILTSTNSSRKRIESYLNTLPWWKLPWRVDDLASDVASILNSAYARDLEQQLVYQTGRFVSLQQSLGASVLRSVTYPPTSPLHSPVLLNSLEQLDAQESRRLSPTSLLSPIERRLAQMTRRSGSPLAHLHLRAQILLLQTYGLSIGGPSLAWGGWAAGVAGEGIAISAGTLCFVLGIRWAVGRWEKAKRRWWESWDRVDEGLERDIKNQFDSVADHTVLAKTNKAAEGLEDLAVRRAEYLQDLSSELETIWRDTLEISGHTNKSTSPPY